MKYSTFIYLPDSHIHIWFEYPLNVTINDYTYEEIIMDKHPLNHV